MDKDIEVTEQTPQADEHEKTVSVQEMLRRLERAEESWQAKYTELEESVASQVDNARKEAQMDGKELQAHREQLLEEEKQKLLDEINLYKQREKEQAMRAETRKTLASKDLPTDDTIVDLVLRSDEEQTLQAINALNGLLSKQREELAGYDQPLTSGGMTAPKASNDIFGILDSGKQTGF